MTGAEGGTEPYEVVWAEAVSRLAASARAEEGWYAEAAGWLVRSGDRLAVDVGCGGGGMTRALAQALSAGRVVGVDGEPAVLATARERVADLTAGSVTVDFVQADLPGDLTSLRGRLDGGADVVWAAAAVHHVGDQQALVDELAGLLALGGRLALAEGGLSPRHLPWDLGVGEPGLEVRLDAARDRWFARMRAELSGSVRMPYGWNEALRRAGLAGISFRSWALETPPPLAAGDRDRVLESLAHRSERLAAAGLIDEDDRAAWARLLDRDDPAWLGARNDIFRLAAHSVHVGIRQGPAG